MHILRLHLRRLIPLSVPFDHGFRFQQAVAGEDYGPRIRHPGEVLETPSKAAEVEQRLIHIDEG